MVTRFDWKGRLSSWNPGSPPMHLTEKTFAQGLRCLARDDPDLAGIIRDWGPPPMWVRPPGFSTLLLIILEQQVSLASARAAFKRLRTTITRVTPRRLLALDDATLRAVGFSRQKAAYARHVAGAIVECRFRPASLPRMSDEAARETLIALKGIGPWSADIYLLMALRRPDVWPKHDLALAVAAQRVKRLAVRPTPDELDAVAVAWKPWRAVAARLLWHHYLSSRAKGRRDNSKGT
jgi:DNA-3-methyladenine glycosylase II